jgi:DNA-binding LacI/PurR family transcriptional regulator
MNPFYGAVTRGAEDVLAREGYKYALLVGNTDSNTQKEDSYYRALFAKRVDGLLLITCPAEYPPAYLSRHNTEKNTCGTHQSRLSRCSRGFSYGGRSGVVFGHWRILLEMGHRRI